MPEGSPAVAPPPRTTVLVVDDDPAFQETICAYLDGYRRLTAYNGWQARQRLEKHHVDVVLLDLNLPDTTGIELLRELRASRDDLEVVVITSHADIGSAVQAVKAGAFDFLAKTLESFQQIDAYIDRALEHRRRRRADIVARTHESLRDGMAQLEATASSSMLEIVRVLRQVAPTPLTVLLEGESGVGKEILARFIHVHSDRSAASFVPVNMGAVPATLIDSTLFGHERGAFTGAERQRLGKFELADGGTLFVDEIGDLEPAAQVKLLRVLQEREVERLGGAEPVPVDVRIVAATNKNLEAEVEAGRFREDLWYRLNVVRLHVPPLRERTEDIPRLVEILANRAATLLKREPARFASEAVAVLAAYPWPGNIRELENLVMRLGALHPGSKIRTRDLPVEYCVDHLGALAVRFAERRKERASLYSLATDHFEHYLVKHMVERCGGNMAEAARRLGVSYATVKNKMYDAPEEGE